MKRTNLGPTVGETDAPVENALAITAPGTYILDPSVSLVRVNVAGAVTVILPSAANPPVVATTQPGLFVSNPITIVDIGGNADAFPITIQPKSGENIMGLAQIQLSTPFGGWTLEPNAALEGWRG
jgi:hypothetical protein